MTNGTRVLGLGNVGPIASLPVMEGKAALLQQFVGISAWPIVLDERDPDAIVETVKRFAAGFGAIQLEDIESPACFHVEARLVDGARDAGAARRPARHRGRGARRRENAMARAGLDLAKARVGVLGLGAAGTAIARMIQGATRAAGARLRPERRRRRSGSARSAASSSRAWTSCCAARTW